MSLLLQRLARQALGTGGPRVRSVATMRAQVPMAAAREQIGARDEAPVQPSAPMRTPTAPAQVTSPEAARKPETHTGAITEYRVIKEVVDEPITRAASGDAGMHRHVALSVPPPAFDQTRTAPPAPAPLLPDVVVAAPPPAIAAIRPAPPRETRTAAIVEPTEVHVHIGRIEVTALPAPAASKRRERPARPSVPLSDYLAKRRSS
jgi:hypothetical protein